MNDKKTIKVLIVDDEKVVGDFLTRFLNLKGIDVKVVEDGLQALEILKQEEFALVFAEIRMPGMGGLEVLREVKKLRPEIKFIITSVYAPQEMLEQAKKEGAIAYLKKPFDIEKISMIIEELHLLQRNPIQRMVLNAREGVKIKDVKCPDFQEGRQNLCLVHPKGLMALSTYELENFCLTEKYSDCPVRVRQLERDERETA